MQITTIGLDIAKNVFQVHGIDAAEKVVVRKQLRRGQMMKFFAALPPCLIGMEACASAHYWARELTKLGHEVRLMPAKDVKAYVKRPAARTAASRGRIHGCTRIVSRKVRFFSLAPRAPSIHGTKCECRLVSVTAASEGTADDMISSLLEPGRRRLSAVTLRSQFDILFCCAQS